MGTEKEKSAFTLQTPWTCTELNKLDLFSYLYLMSTKSFTLHTAIIFSSLVRTLKPYLWSCKHLKVTIFLDLLLVSRGSKQMCCTSCLFAAWSWQEQQKGKAKPLHNFNSWLVPIYIMPPIALLDLVICPWLPWSAAHYLALTLE